MTVMSGVAVQAGVDPMVRRGRVVRIVLAVLLLGGWVVWAASTYQSQLRVVGVDTFHDDLAAGHVIAFRAASNVRHDSTWLPDGSPDLVDLPATHEDGTLDREQGFTSEPPPTVVYWTGSAVGAVRVVDLAHGSVESADALIQELRDAGVPPAGPANDWPGDQADLWGLATVLLALVAVVRGPAPTRGTRWFWFWTLGATWALGVVAHAVLELVRPRAALPAASVETAPVSASQASEEEPDPRLRWWAGLLLALVGSFLISWLGSEFSRAVGGVWVPLP